MLLVKIDAKKITHGDKFSITMYINLTKVASAFLPRFRIIYIYFSECAIFEVAIVFAIQIKLANMKNPPGAMIIKDH